MKKRILEFINNHPETSFVELEREFTERFRGDNELIFEEKNVFFWGNITEKASNTIIELLREELIEVSITDPIIYKFHGKIPALPVAEKIPEEKFEELKWLPVLMEITDKGRKYLEEV